MRRQRGAAWRDTGIITIWMVDNESHRHRHRAVFWVDGVMLGRNGIKSGERERQGFGRRRHRE